MNSSSVKYVHFGVAGKLLDGLARGRRTIYVTDSNLLRSWGGFFEGKEVLLMGIGEQHKSLEEYQRLCCELLRMGADRATLLVGVGGGIVSDMTGFLGTTFMRGMPFGFIPTTLLGQIDAAIGGKNGVNVGGYKNILGTFSTPEFVIVDGGFLSTLPEGEHRAAWGELLKYELLMGKELLGDESSVRSCVEYKLRIVEQDLRDRGVRHILNLGHTFAHAVEALTEGRIAHGQAVALGLVLMGRMSVALGLLDSAVADRIEQRVRERGLMCELPEGVSGSDMVRVMWGDKKRVGGQLRMVFLQDFGAAVVRDVSGEELSRFFNV